MDLVQTIFDQSNSRQEFYKNLQAAGLKLIEKQGRPIGFRDSGGRRFYFHKIGLTEYSFQYLDDKRMSQINRIKSRLDLLEQKQTSQDMVNQIQLNPKQKRQ
jgi:hypothetical protein